ncbi:MAG: phosphoribosyltransferase [Planctomycetes bacterium]|nr:phosphoribosyltransferase [Planctomycetota bacterium]
MTVLPERYRDRAEAGRVLAEELAGRVGADALVLGIPRGGVPVAYEVARALRLELGVCIVRKVGAPGYPEVAVGAVTADGDAFLFDDSLRAFAVDERQLGAEVARERERARELRATFGVHALDPQGREVLLVDDGLATGATVLAALRALRAQGARRVVVAVPVGSYEACARLAREADELVCPLRPPAFRAVGEHYDAFGQTSTEAALALLDDAANARDAER